MESTALSLTMLWLYRLLFLPMLLALAPRYLRRMWRRGGYAENFTQRFGGHDVPARKEGTKRVWLQAVSVGEVLAVGPLIDGLRRDGAEVYLTTTTSTGYGLAKERYAASTIGIGYFPLDWWWFSRRAWRRIDPDLAVLTEGERWPEHIRQANVRGVAVVSINARMSDRSFARLRRMRFAARLVLDGITRLLPGSAQDEARFRELGFPPVRMQTLGNMKLDVTIPPLAAADRAQLRRELGLRDGLVLLGSSTWPGEEAALVAAWKGAREAGLPCALLIVPRHAERRGEVERVLAEAGVTHHLRSRGAAAGLVDVAVGDTTGELRKLTQVADLVFVGKSLPPNEGGQTPVEPAALRKPLLFGPAMSNFRAIAAELVARGAARVVANEAELAEQVKQLLRDTIARGAMADAAEKWQRENAGAVERTLAVLSEELARS